VIKIIHKKFDGAESERKVKPYLLKEYNNRWYLVGYDDVAGGIRYFGLDRILRTETTAERFDVSEAAGVKDLFGNRIGISGDTPPEEVVLQFDDSQIGYFRTYPWHESARISRDKNNNWLVHMFVSINYELEQLILMNHAFVRVIQPVWLAQKMKKMLKETLKKY
jgi:predicted DNA-binding transcriptional regulator YafY